MMSYAAGFRLPLPTFKVTTSYIAATIKQTIWVLYYLFPYWLCPVWER
jgi:hypothetical protein